MDVGSYCVNASRLLAGEPEALAALSWVGETGTDWVTEGMMRFPGGVLAIFDCGTAMPSATSSRRSAARARSSSTTRGTATKPGDRAAHATASVERIEIEREDSYRLELENVSDAIRGEAELLLGRDDAIGQARALEALHESATNGAPRRRSRPDCSIARSASCSSTSPGRPLTPTAPTRTLVLEDGDAAEEEREERVEARALDRVVAHLLRELPRRARVAPGGRVGLALRVQARVGRGAVHRRRRDELAVRVRDDRPTPAPDASETTCVDDRAGAFEPHRAHRNSHCDRS